MAMTMAAAVAIKSIFAGTHGCLLPAAYCVLPECVFIAEKEAHGAPKASERSQRLVLCDATFGGC